MVQHRIHQCEWIKIVRIVKEIGARYGRRAEKRHNNSFQILELTNHECRYSSTIMEKLQINGFNGDLFSELLCPQCRQTIGSSK